MTSTDPLRARIDDESLREVDVDTAAVAALADELDGATDSTGLGRRAVALRLLDRLDDAEECARRAVAAAEAEQDPRRLATARIRLGHVLHLQGRFTEAEAEFAIALSEAEQVGDQRLRAFALQHRGKSRFDEGRVAEAERDFTAALQVRRRTGAADDEVASSEQAVTAAMRRLVAGAGRH